MSPAWNMQLSESVSSGTVSSLCCAYLYFIVFVVFTKDIFSYTASPCEPCVMTRCFNTPHNVRVCVCMAVVT